MTANNPHVFASDLTRIDAWMQDLHCGKFFRASFSPASILRLVETAKDSSVIVLSDGAQIPVAMGYADLCQKIYEPDFRKDSVLNLFDKTGENVAAVKLSMVPAPTGAFNATARVPSPGEVVRKAKDSPAEGMTIRAFVRKAETDNYQLLTVHESRIDWGGLFQENSGRNGPYISVPLLGGFKDPFGEKSTMIEMTHQRFMELYTTAKIQGGHELDLCLETRPRLKTPVEKVKFRKIAMFIRKKGTQNYTLDICKNEDCIKWEDIREIKDINGPAIIIPLRDNSRSDFGDDYLLVDIPQAEFMRLYMNAMAQGLREFDLRQETGRFIAPDRGAGKAPAP